MVLKREDGKSTYTIVDSKNIMRVYRDPWVKGVIGEFENEKRVTDKLVLSYELNIMKNGIEQLLSRDCKDERNIMKLQSLQSRYQSWSSKKLSSELVDQIGEYCLNDEE